MLDPVDARHVDLAQRLADRAREVLVSDRDRAFEPKADGSPVTALDRAVESALRTEIAAAAPDHGIIGEEHGPENAERDWVWILDPIDGTRQFAAGLATFGTLIALCHKRRPVIGVIAHPLTGMVCIGVSGVGTRIDGRPGCDAVRAASL